MGADGAHAHDLAQLLRLEQRTPLQLDWTPGLHAAACEAAREGNIAVLRTLLARSGFHLTTHCEGQLSGKLHYCSPPASTVSTQCPQLRHQCKCRDASSNCQQVLDFCRCALRIYKAAADSGQVPVLAWLFGQVHPFPWEMISDETCSFPYMKGGGSSLEKRMLVAAAANEKLQVLAWLHAQLPADLWSGSLFAAFKAAAQANRLAAVMWLHDHSDPEDCTATFSSAAAESGHPNILRWLCLECVPPCPVDASTMASAAGSGRLESLLLLRSLNPPCPMDESATREAMCHGQLPCLAWLRSLDPPCPWHSGTLTAAARHGAFEAIKMARSLEPPCEWDSDTVLAAIKENNPDIVAWLLEHGAPHPRRHQVHDALCSRQCAINRDRRIYLVLSAHQIPMAEHRMLATQRLRACWCTLMGLVRWARCAQPMHQGPNALKDVTGCQQAQHSQAGVSLLTQIARLPDELVYHIGAAAGIFYQKGGRVFRTYPEYDYWSTSDDDF